jgi:hypothetical protein
MLNSRTESGLRVDYDETVFQIKPDDHELTILDAIEDVRFINTESHEELIIRQRGNGFEFIYVDDPNDNVEQWYSLIHGFVRRLSLKKGASQNNGSVDNVVPFP